MNNKLLSDLGMTNAPKTLIAEIAKLVEQSDYREYEWVTPQDNIRCFVKETEYAYCKFRLEISCNGKTATEKATIKNIQLVCNQTARDLYYGKGWGMEMFRRKKAA